MNTRMKKLIVALIILLPAMAWSQVDTTWRFEGNTGLKFDQASFSNWTAGGINSYAFSAFAKLYANHKKDKFSWNNNLNLMFGMNQNKGESMKKNEDVIDLTTILGYDISKYWAFTGNINFKTQFANGYDTDNDSIKISAFMAPAYLTVSPSFRYQPVEWFSLYLSPATAKLTMVLDTTLANLGAFGVKAAEYDTLGNKISNSEKTLFYLGPYVEAYLKKDIAKNLNLESKLKILYTFINRNDLKGYDADISWENYLNYQFAKFFSLSFFLNLAYYPSQPILKYDESAMMLVPEPNRKVQVKETLGIGITYNFQGAK